MCAPRLGRLVAGKVTLSFMSQAVLFQDGDSAPVAWPQRSVVQDTCTSTDGRQEQVNVQWQLDGYCQPIVLWTAHG